MCRLPPTPSARYTCHMEAKSVGQAGLRGWRASVANAVAPRVSQRTGMSEGRVQALIGLAFLALSVMYVVKSARELVHQFQSS
jgi:hypothetical protein